MTKVYQKVLDKHKAGNIKKSSEGNIRSKALKRMLLEAKNWSSRNKFKRLANSYNY